MSNRNFASGGKLYSHHVMPALVDCNFVVDSANGNGLGIRSLKGPLVKNVYMHTSASPAAGNPNPESGAIVVQLESSWNRSYSGFNSIISPVSGSAVKVDNSAMTVGVPYVITTLGNTTAAQWITLGVPSQVTPAVGVAFVALLVGVAGEANTSTSRVMAAAATGSGVCTIESVGDPNASIAPNSVAAQGYGAQFILICRDYAGAIVAPTDGSVISLAFYLSNSSVLVGGE